MSLFLKRIKNTKTPLYLMPCQAEFFFAEICFFFADNRRHASTHWHSSNFPFSSCTPLSVSVAVLYSVLASAKPLNRWICYSGRTSWIVFHSHHYIKQQAPSSRAVFSPDGRFHFVLFLSFIFITVQFSADIPAYGNMYSVLSFFLHFLLWERKPSAQYLLDIC